MFNGPCSSRATVRIVCFSGNSLKQIYSSPKNSLHTLNMHTVKRTLATMSNLHDPGTAYTAYAVYTEPHCRENSRRRHHGKYWRILKGTEGHATWLVWICEYNRVRHCPCPCFFLFSLLLVPFVCSLVWYCRKIDTCYARGTIFRLTHCLGDGPPEPFPIRTNFK